MAEDLGLRERVLFVTEGADNLVKVFARSTVYLRPTAQDGDALAVREALSFGVPVVASDVAFRPKEAALFPSRDLEAFEKVVRKVLDNLEDHRKALAGHRPDDKYQALLDVYRELLSQGARPATGSGAFF